FTSFKLDFTVPFTFWAGLLGGTFLTMASHGTDQLLVQRLLTCRNKRDSQKAIILRGFVVLFQFALFLLIGSMLFAYYQTGATKPVLESNDQVFPFFIVRQLPHGISGLVIAGDKPLVNPNVSDDYLLRLSRWITVGWGMILILIAIASKSFTKSVLNTALTIASLPYGAMLGAFLLGVLTKRANQRGVMTGMAVALCVMLFVWLRTPLAWTWYVLTGTIICSSV